MDTTVGAPLSADVTPALNVGHEALEWSSIDPHVFLVLEADNKPKDPLLTAKWIRQDGKQLNEVVLPLSKLTR